MYQNVTDPQHCCKQHLVHHLCHESLLFPNFASLRSKFIRSVLVDTLFAYIGLFYLLKILTVSTMQTVQVKQLK
jgi:hypothetical protein